MSRGDAPGRPPGGDRGGELVFRTADLPEVRDAAAAYARRLGMPEDAVDDLVLAVNEVATNAVTHGADTARLRLRSEAGHLVVDVHDEGRWRPAGPPGRTAPVADAPGGMGLWVAARLSDGIGFRWGAGGTTVTLRFRLDPGPRRPPAGGPDRP